MAQVYVGVVGGEQSSMDFTAPGDSVNVTARLACEAGTGQILISDAAFAAAELDQGDLEQRHLELKGKSEPTGARVLRLGRE